VTDAQTGGPAQVPASALGSMLGPHRVPGGAVVAEPLAASVQVVTLTDTESRPSHPSWPLVPAAEGEPFVPGPTLGSRTTWIAVRVDARPLAELGPGVRAAPGPQQAPPELAQLVRRLDRQLDAEGIRVQVLDASGLIGALSRCCFPVPADPPAGEEPAVQPVAPQELRAAWRSPWREHAGLWLERWPQPKDAQRLLSQLSGAAAAQTLVSLRVAAAAASAEPRFDVRGLVVVATRPGELDAACAEVQALAAAAGGRLFRLDGEHAPALYAAAPSGGGPR
jgi:type VII secretion protein EccE